MNLAFKMPTRAPYSAKNMTKPVSFFFAAPNAKSVCLAGDFNDWNPTSHPMQRRENGWWYLQVPLTHGHNLYQFLVDGEPTLDPHAAGVRRNEHDEVASVMAVN
jgi:1,4-alpha-glucan branching enzyme